MHFRYFIINSNTDVMHIHGLCQHTKLRRIPIRLFDTQQELEAYAGRKLRLCTLCAKEKRQWK